MNYVEIGANTPTTSALPQGISDHQQPVAPPIVKTWPNSAWGNLGGIRWTKKSEIDDLSVWCNSNGDWGISQTVSDRSFWGNDYGTLVEFGHMEGNDSNSFVLYASYWNSDIDANPGPPQTGMAHGSADPHIKVNFSKINAARVIVNRIPSYRDFEM